MCLFSLSLNGVPCVESTVMMPKDQQEETKIGSGSIEPLICSLGQLKNERMTAALYYLRVFTDVRTRCISRLAYSCYLVSNRIPKDML